MIYIIVVVLPVVQEINKVLKKKKDAPHHFKGVGLPFKGRVGLRFKGVGLHLKGVALRFKGVGLRFKGVGLHFKGIRLRFKGVAIHFKGLTLRFLLFAAPYACCLGSHAIAMMCLRKGRGEKLSCIPIHRENGS